ncbi:MAG: hypothetical protein RL694_729, partial [Actinomycetota bacterium]
MRKNRKIIAITLAIISVISLGALSLAPAQAAEPDRYITVT